MRGCVREGSDLREITQPRERLERVGERESYLEWKEDLGDAGGEEEMRK